jgi:hypothetical protein
VLLQSHLMVSKPEQWVSDFAKIGVEQYTFHIEATGECCRCGALPRLTRVIAEDPEALIAQIRKAGMKVCLCAARQAVT